MSSLILSKKVNATLFNCIKRFIDNLYAINDGGKSAKPFLEIFPKELKLKVEHHGNRASFLKQEQYLFV